jgi:hypothetical protein
LSQSVTPNSIPIRDTNGYLKDFGYMKEITVRTSNTLISTPTSQVSTYRINVGE